MLPNLQFPLDLVIFTEEILNGKLHFLCSVRQTIHLNIFQRYLSTKFQSSKKRFYEICHSYIMDYTFIQFK